MHFENGPRSAPVRQDKLAHLKQSLTMPLNMGVGGAWRKRLRPRFEWCGKIIATSTAHCGIGQCNIEFLTRCKSSEECTAENVWIISTASKVKEELAPGRLERISQFKKSQSILPHKLSILFKLKCLAPRLESNQGSYSQVTERPILLAKLMKLLS